jgi:hypothetical protein
MDPEQMGVYEQVEHDLRLALNSLSEQHMDEVAGIQEMRKLVRAAHEIAESVLLGRFSVIEQRDPLITRILRDIAKGSK